MVLKLFGHPFSTCTKRVLTVLEETNTPYEIVRVDVLGGEHKGEAFLAKQPFGQIPVLDDDGFLVYESRAIARYVAAKARSPLLPTDARAAARFEQAASVETANFDPSASAIFVERFFKPRRGLPTDDARVAEVTATLAGKLAAYEVILSKQCYLAGDELTLADLFHLPYGSYLAPHGVDFLENAEKYPNVARWWKELTARPSWQKVKEMNA